MNIFLLVLAAIFGLITLIVIIFYQELCKIFEEEREREA